MEEIKEEKLEEFKRIQEVLIKQFEPLAIILFGSYARGTQNNDRDIDLAIISSKADKKQIFEIKQELEEISSKDVDLVNLKDKNISEGLRYEVLMSGKVLYCLDEYKFEMYKIEKIKEYLDFNESRQNIIDRIKNGGSIYGK